MPDIIRTSRSYAHRRRAQGIGGFLAAIGAIASFPAAAAEQPALSLQELVLTAHRSIDQHEIAFFALVFGVILFAVVTAVMLLRTRARAARLETWSRDEIHPASRRARSRQRGHSFRTADRRGLAGGLRRARHRRRSGGLGRIRIASRAGVRQLARCRQSKRDGARGGCVARARRSVFDDAHDARRPPDRGPRPRHRRPRRAAAEGRQRHQARACRSGRPLRAAIERARGAARTRRKTAVAGMDARRGGTSHLRQCRLHARRRGEKCGRRRRTTAGIA